MDPKPPAASFSAAGCHRLSYFSQLLLRFMAIAFTVAAAAVMAASHQTVTLFGFDLEARYGDSPSFRFCLAADCVACGLSVVSVMLAVSLDRPKSNHRNYFYLMLIDMVSLLVLLSGFSAAAAVGYVGRFGMKQSGWMAVCDRVPKFCDKITASVASTFGGVVCLFVLVLISAYKLKSG